MCSDYGKYALVIYYFSNNIIGKRTVVGGVVGRLHSMRYSVEWLIVNCDTIFIIYV